MTKIQHPHDVSGLLTIYAVILHPDGRVWSVSGGAYEALATLNWDDYALALAEEDTTLIYSADTPAGLDAISHDFLIYNRVGGSRVPADDRIGVGTINGPVIMPDVDGLSHETMMKVLVAFAVNLNSVTDNGDGSRTVEFKQRDGTTTAATVRYTTDDGERSVSSIP